MFVKAAQIKLAIQVRNYKVACAFGLKFRTNLPVDASSGTQSKQFEQCQAGRGRLLFFCILHDAVAWSGIGQQLRWRKMKNLVVYKLTWWGGDIITSVSQKMHLCVKTHETRVVNFLKHRSTVDCHRHDVFANRKTSIDRQCKHWISWSQIATSFDVGLFMWEQVQKCGDFGKYLQRLVFTSFRDLGPLDPSSKPGTPGMMLVFTQPHVCFCVGNLVSQGGFRLTKPTFFWSYIRPPNPFWIWHKADFGDRL